MMGYFRLFLSLVIIQAHTSTPGPHHVWASLAVLCFYAISGYGCTAAMQGSYYGRAMRFLASRYLRLWPTYAVVFCLSCWLMLWAPIPLAHIPRGVPWIGNLLMLRSDAVPVAWVLPYMLLGYLAIALGVSSTPRRAAAWLLLSFVWAQHRALLLDWGGYYNGLAVASLAYAVGAAAFWLGVQVPRDKGMGEWAGAISFPMFLVHPLVVAVMPMGKGWPLFFSALPPALALSWLLWRFIEVPVDRYRKAFRKPKET
jgi:peptidoglycan/LPS O-acetylase OafA/YrhL